MFGLNDTATFLWRAVETVSDSEQLARMISSEEDGSQGVSVVEEFCRQLESLGLLLIADPEEAVNSKPVEVPRPEELSPPRVLWQEALERIAATCAFMPAQNPLCTQVPFS